MINLKSVAVFLFLICLVLTSQAQEMPLSVSTASFKNLADDRGDFTELYYMISRSQIQFIEEEDAFVAPFTIKLTILDAAGNEVYGIEEKSGIRATTKNQTDLTQNVIDLLTFYLKPGEYTYILDLSGEGLTEQLVRKGRINSPDFSNDKLQLSQIEFCSNISTDLTVAKFIKNHLMVYPNPSEIFDINKPIVFFYAEIYNMVYNPDEPESEYGLTFIILDANGDTVKVYPEDIKKKAGSTSVIASYLNVRKLKTGKYQLTIKIKDFSTGQIVSVSKEFKVEELARITVKDAELFRKMVTYTANPRDLEIFDKLNLIGKQTFIQNYWKQRDPTPDTPENEFRQLFIQRWNFVNTRYVNESLSEEGWQTDRGRIYLLHGPPSDVERYLGDPQKKDYEIWLYEGGNYGLKKFIFADVYMRGKYYLIHSESPDQQEVYNPNWEKSVSIR